MNTLSYKTLSANKENANKRWYLVDLDGEVLGRAASKIAKVLRGKYKTNFELDHSAKKLFDEELKKYSYNWRSGGQFATEERLDK